MEEDHSGPIPWAIKLWAAVIRRASVDWVLYKGHHDVKLNKLGVEAGHWLFDDDDETTVNSFPSVCLYLNIDKDLLRSKARALTEEDARRLRGMEFCDDY